MMSCNVTNRRRGEFLAIQQEADRKRALMEQNLAMSERKSPALTWKQWLERAPYA